MHIIPYACRVGSIMYGIICMRSGLTYVIRIVSQFMVSLGQVHYEDLKFILRYLSGSLNLNLKYTRSTQEEDVLNGFLEVNYAENMDTRKIISIFVLNLFGMTISYNTH